MEAFGRGEVDSEGLDVVSHGSVLVDLAFGCPGIELAIELKGLGGGERCVGAFAIRAATFALGTAGAV